MRIHSSLLTRAPHLLQVVLSRPVHKPINPRTHTLHQVGGEHYCEKHARAQTAKEKKKGAKAKKGEKVEKEKKAVKAKPNKCAKCKKKVRFVLLASTLLPWPQRFAHV